MPVPWFVLDELSRCCAGKEHDELMFGGGTTYLPGPKSSGGWFAAAVKHAGVQPITPHDLRHTSASLAISAGVNVLALDGLKDVSQVSTESIELPHHDRVTGADVLHEGR